MVYGIWYMVYVYVYVYVYGICIFSGPAASSRLRLFEVVPCHVKRILCYDMAG